MGPFLRQYQATGAKAGHTNADYENWIVNILNTKETLVHDSTFQLHKVKANLQAMKKHLANFKELSGGGGGDLWHCIDLWYLAQELL